MLKIDEKTVRRHANELVAREVLRRSGFQPGGSVKHSRGPKAKPYEDSIPTRKTDRVGSVAGAPQAALRVHRGGCAFEVRGPISAIPWKSRWVASGVPNFATRDAAGNRFWVVRGQGRSHNLLVQPTEEFVYDPAEVEGARAARVARVRALAEAFVEEHDLKFVSTKAHEFQPVEYAVEMAGLEKFGEAGSELFWVDGSPGDGRLEAETQNPELGKLLLGWPDFVSRLTAAEQNIEHAKVAVHGLLGLHEKVVEIVAPKPGKPAKPLPPADDPAVA